MVTPITQTMLYSSYGDTTIIFIYHYLRDNRNLIFIYQINCLILYYLAFQKYQILLIIQNPYNYIIMSLVLHSDK